MYHQSVTIEEAVRQIQNENYLLPAIQREIVWERDQITDLFDSVLQGYPIGTFLFWDVRDENRDEYTMYGFIKDYITSTKYVNTTADSRNSIVKPDGAGDLKLILDGQQRLSSFYIGLLGTYTYKQRYKWYRNEDAWKRSRLFFKLTSDPQKQKESGGDRQTRYEFQFLPESDYDGRVVQRGDDFWFRVGAILDYPKSNDVDDYVFQLSSELDLDREKERLVGQNLRALKRATHDQKYITYFEEKEQNIDRVLEIFIRTNDGGTQLRKSDLLLSIAQANWQQYNAREQLTSFVDHLNTQLPKTNDYDKDFILKSSLVLTDLPVRYRVGQFNRENVAEIENQWPEIKQAIKQAATLVNYFGIGEKRLLSKNAVIPIAYFFKKTGFKAVDLLADDRKRHKIKQDIKRWFITSLLNGTLSGNADTVLRRTREAIREEEGDGFPVRQINREVSALGKVVGFNEDIADNILEYEKGKRRTFLALTLLYDHVDFGSIQYDQDHIFPRSLLDTETLSGMGVDIEQAKRFEECADKLANLQLLTGKENRSKQDMPFDEWITGQNESFYERHLIPQDRALYKMENFDRFLKERGKLIKNELMSVLQKPVG
jgi:hypothetical protein